MFLRKLLPVTMLLFTVSFVHAQDIPKGVNYKRAPDSVNEKAKKSLEAALAITDTLPPDFFNDATVVGPMLWHSLKPSASELLLKANPTILMVPGPKPFAAEATRVLTDEQRKAFWTLLQSKFANLKESKVRKANAQEISYYWSTIPFDIEEPFWVIESGSDRFIAHFMVKAEQPRLFWIDLVGDLQTLNH